jgi:hypothetical protein
MICGAFYNNKQPFFPVPLTPVHKKGVLPSKRVY